MAIDLAAEFVAALRSSAGRDALAEAIEPVMERVVRRVLAEREEKLEPLGRILNVTNSAAQMRLLRNPELRKVGVRVGRRTLFRRALVEAFFAARA